MAPEEQEEDDYLTMTFAEPTTTKAQRETLTERKKRLALESELRGRPKSKAELAADEARKRDEALTSSTLAPSNKGFRMMAALGYKPGQVLGSGKQDGLLEPVGVEMKSDRGGIGADSEKKRKVREEMEKLGGEEKKRKVDAEEYRERMAMEREEKRKQGQLYGAMKVGEKFEEEKDAEGDAEAQNAPTATAMKNGESNSKRPRSTTKPLKSINVLWRSLVRQQRVAERDKRMKHDVQSNLLSRLPTYDDPDEDHEDRIAFAKRDQVEEVALDLDEEDAELDEFEALDVSDRLRRVVEYLREQWHYCFWCKFRYDSDEMEGCPGVLEEDHD